MAADEEFLGELRLGRRLTTIPQISARGLVVLLGLLFLITDRALELTGKAIIAADVLILLLLGLTLLNLLELLAGSSERGGTYALIHETLGAMGGFVSGWSLLAGAIMLTAALTRNAADHLSLSLQAAGINIPHLGPWLFAGLVLIQLFSLLPRREWLWPVLIGLLLIFGIVMLTALPSFDAEAYQIETPMRSGGFMRTTAWLAVLFAGIEAVMASRRQIRDSVNRLPSALVVVLVGGGLLFIAAQVLALCLPKAADIADGISLASVVGSYNVLPSWITSSFVFLASLMAANGSLMIAARQLGNLGSRGALPPMLRRVSRPFRVPPLLFGILLITILPLILWVPSIWLVDLAAAFYLVSVLLLNWAAVYSRRSEPSRRRLIVVPFFPLVPSAVIAISTALLLSLPMASLLWGGVWLLIGLGVYLFYSRIHLIEAREGVMVFGKGLDRERTKEKYRILVPLGAGMDRNLLLDLATALARQMNGEVLPLQVIPMADPLAIEEGRRIARERNTLFQWSTRETAKSGVPTFPITRLARNVSDGILETAVEELCDLVLLSWSIRPTQRGVRMGRVLDPVIRLAPCDVAVIAYHPERYIATDGKTTTDLEQDEGKESIKEREDIQHFERILVPTAGGPHAPLATRIALLLARETNATTSVVYVADPEASQDELAEGQVRIEKTLEAMRKQMKDLPGVEGEHRIFDALQVESKVVISDSVVDGIAEAGAESDLVLIGASEESLIDQVLFGTVPEQVAKACPSPVLMVKRFRGLRRFWLQRIWDTLFGSLPKLSRQEQVAVYRQVRRDARPDVDFFVMIGLSAIIATYGLLQNSSAVIIGAMLVAPLFTPILALSVAIVHGDIRLLRLAVESALKGIVLAIGLAILLTAISPLRTVTTEIGARTHPNLFDLAVALASGAAGAYAVARKDVATALPGVAIAAALVPPLGVTGVGLAIGNPRIAGGGGLLFITNLIAITLAGSVVLTLLGFRPTARARREAHLRWGMMASLVLLTAITIPLAVVFVGSVQESRLEQSIDQVLTQQLASDIDYELVDFEFEDHGAAIEVTVTMYSRDIVSKQLVESVRSQLSEVLERRVHLILISIPIMAIEVQAP